MLFLLTAMLGSCAPLPADSLSPTTTATDASAPTPTIVWFPASPTPPPQSFPTEISTPEQKPGVGAATLRDDFSQPELWHPGSSNQGSALIAENNLALTVPAGSSILRIREDLVLNDFYAELTARPSLCRDQDEYGLLVRASAVAYYRLSLLCNGTLRLDRVSGNSHQNLLPVTPSGDVPTGVPAEVRIGVWAAGSEMRFFLNDHYQFSMDDGNYLSGTLGVFVRSVADTPVAVAFSNLTIYDVNYSPPAKTPAP